MFKSILNKIQQHSSKIGVIGLGYVGLPLVLRFAEENFHVTGFDTDPEKITALNDGQSYINHIPAATIQRLMASGRFESTTAFETLREMDAIIICVPTPLTEHREPDMTYVQRTAETIAKYLRQGQVISLESTTYPGTTDEVIRPELERSGLKVGRDFFLVFSPEREDPANPHFSTKTIPKVVGGVTPQCLEVGQALYGAIVDTVVPVSSTKAAELSKLLENIYRSVNIALVNEMKLLADRMGLDIWEIIAAAATKPFGYQPFYPGPGLGGHCIPIDPFYLTWKAREFGFTLRFIEHAGEVNILMPAFVLEKLADALNERRKSLNGAKVLIIGLAYKPDVDDMRESPALPIMKLLEEKKAVIAYHDPYIPEIPRLRRWDFDFTSVALTPENIAEYDAVLIITNHSGIDYQLLVDKAQLIIDTRNATARCKGCEGKVVKA